MKNTIVLICFALTMMTANAQKVDWISRQEKLLFKAYKQGSDRKLSKFFDKWQKEIPTITFKEVAASNDTIQEAYAVFTAFYHLKSIKKLGGFKNNVQDFFDDAKFLLIQNKLDLRITEQVYWTEAEADSIATATINKLNLPESSNKMTLRQVDGKLNRFSVYYYGPTSDRNKLHLVNERSFGMINNFRPVIDLGDKQPVYLSQGYQKSLNTFLGPSNVLPSIDSDEKTLSYFRDLPLRREFLRKRSKFLSWNGYHLHSAPYIRKMTFDKDLKYARVDYQIWTEGGEAFLKKDKDKWVLLSATRLWIE